MEAEARACLNDVLNATRLLSDFTLGKTFSDYVGDPLLRSATERQFGIIGEAISRLAKIDGAAATRISGYQRIISFRNILIHDYDAVDNQVVWDVLQRLLPILVLEVRALLQEK